MFTGIIRHTGEIVSVRSAANGKRITVSAVPEFLSRLEKGITSVAMDGACHTVEDASGSGFTVYAGFETLRRTTLAEARTGSVLNLELPVTPQSLLDGHIVQGHVDGTGRVSSFTRKGEAWQYRFSAPREILRFLVDKDSIAVDGISLTLFDADDSSFAAAVIPETAKNTTLGKKKEGSPVNLEVNIFAKYAFQFGKERLEKYSAFFGQAGERGKR